MIPVFDILPVELVSEQTNLFVEISNDSFTYFFKNDTNNTITGLTVFHFDKKKLDVNIPGLIEHILSQQSVLNNKYHKVFTSYAFNESILIPGEYYDSNQNSKNLNLVFGDLHGGIILADYIEEKKIYNSFRVPQAVHYSIVNHFPEVKFIHQYSVLLRKSESDDNILNVIFYQTKIIVALVMENKLQIIQTFKYVTETNVVYHMLNICDQFKVKDVSIKLCGMIEKNSSMFKEMQKYFLHINFDELPDRFLYDQRIKELPNHFFSHLFSIAL